MKSLLNKLLANKVALLVVLMLLGVGVVSVTAAPPMPFRVVHDDVVCTPTGQAFPSHVDVDVAAADNEFVRFVDGDGVVGADVVHWHAVVESVAV